MTAPLTRNTQTDGTVATPCPSLTVLIVNFNSWPDVARLVTSLGAAPELADGRSEILVIDNASDGPIPAELERPLSGVRLILRVDNAGFAAGVNAGWREARGRWLLLVNPDVLAGPDLIGAVLSRIERLEARGPGMPGVVGFGLRNPDGSRQGSVGAEPTLARVLVEPFLPRSRRKYKAGWRTRPGPVSWVTGACALVHSELLAELGGMDEDYFLYHEEVALCRSARDLGRTIEYDPSIEVVHLRPLQSRSLSPMLRVITRHSKLLYFLKHRKRWEFLLLSRLAQVEAAVRGPWASGCGRIAEAKSWKIVARLARAMRGNAFPRGREVLAIASLAEDRAADHDEAEVQGSRSPRHHLDSRRSQKLSPKER